MKKRMKNKCENCKKHSFLTPLTADNEQCEAAYNAPFPSFPVRLAQDIASVLTLSGFNVHELSRKFHSFFPITSAWRDETFESIITILTESGTLFGLTSADGHKLWSISLTHLCHENDGNSDGEYRIVSMLKVLGDALFGVFVLFPILRLLSTANIVIYSGSSASRSFIGHLNGCSTV